MPLHLVALIFLSLAGCASVSGNKQIIAIDSNPRGMLVHSPKNGISPQETPFFAKIDRHDELEFLYQPHKNSPQQEERISCSYRYLESGVGSLVFIPYPFLIPISIGLDFISGAAYQCPSTIQLGKTLRATSPDTRAPCRRQIVFPPYSLGQKTSAAVMAHWQSTLRHLDEYRCSEDLAPEEVLPLLNYFNVNLSKELNLATESPSNLQEIGYTTGADRIVYFSPRSDDDTELHLDVVTIDLYTTQEVRRKSSLSIRADEQVKPYFFKKIFHYGLINFPNSLTYGYQLLQNTPTYTEDPYRIEDIKSRTSPLDIIANFSLTSVNHQRGFAPFSVNWSLFPALTMSYDDNEYVLHNVAEDVRTTYKVNNYFMFVPLTAQVLLYLPVGALSGRIGLGPLMLIQQDNVDQKFHFFTRFSRSLGVGYRLFGGGNFYGYVDYNKMFFPIITASKTISLVNYRQEQNVLIFGIGYYFGQNTWHHVLNRSQNFMSF